MTRYAPLWQQGGNYSASLDRSLMATVWPIGGVLAAAPITTVLSTMQVSLAADTALVPIAGGGCALCRWSTAEVATLAASPATGQSRIDLVVCQVRDNALDSGGNNDFIFSAVTGVPAVSNPVRPNVPANALGMCAVTVVGGTAVLDGATIVDLRPQGLSVPGQPVSYPLATDLALTSTTAQRILQGTYTPARRAVRVELVATGFNAVAMNRVYFRAAQGTTLGQTVVRLCSPMSAVTPQAFFAGGSAFFYGLTPGTLYTFGIDAWVDAGGTFRCRPVSQPSLESMAINISDA
jgi:hypothetical protein